MRLLYLLGSGNDHGKFAVLCGFCGLFAAAAAGGMLPPGFLAFDLGESATALHAWGKGVAAATAAAAGGGDGAAAAGAGAGTTTTGGVVSEEDFVAAVFLPVVVVTAACVTAAAALPAIRFAQVYICA